MITVYIAHPFGAGSEALRNLARASNWYAWAAEYGVAPIADWTITASVWGEDRREQGFAINFEHIRRCDEIWLCGSRTSPGMAEEHAHALKHGLRVRDFTHLGAHDPPPYDPSLDHSIRHVKERL